MHVLHTDCKQNVYSKVTSGLWIILGDPAVSRAGRKGAMKVFKHGQKNPWVRTRSSKYWLLIGHKKCFVLLCPIGEQHLLSSFCEFVHDYWLDHSLSGSCTKEIHTESGNFQFDINSPFQNNVYPKTKDAFPKIQAWAFNRYSRLHRSRLRKN